MTTGISLQELRLQLAASRAGLLQAISGVSEQQFKRRPIATSEESQAWCIAEVLTHLLIDEKLWTSRIELALASDGSGVQPSDREQHAAAVRAGRLAPVPQIIHGLLAARRDLERAVEAADQRNGGQLAVVQPERGLLSVEWMLRKVIEHENEHVDHIEAVKQKLAAEVSPTPSISGGPER